MPLLTDQPRRVPGVLRRRRQGRQDHRRSADPEPGVGAV